MTIVTKDKVYVASESTGFDYQICFKEIKPNYVMDMSLLYRAQNLEIVHTKGAFTYDVRFLGR